MIAHRIELTLQQDGKVALDNLPFHAGEAVEIIVMTAPARVAHPQYPLRGTPLHYERPFEPVSPEDWDAAA